MRQAVVLATIVVLFADVRTNASAQTVVQLPTIRNFGMSTTVSVPDRGRVYLGGINRSHSSSSRRRIPLSPLSSRSYSRGTSSNGASVSAFVHDFDEMDRAILSQATSRASNAATKPNQLSGIDSQEQTHQLPRVSDVRRHMAAKKAAQYAVAAAHIRTAVRFENAGKYTAARVKYRAAYANSKPEWQMKIRSRLKRIDHRIAQQPRKQASKL